MPNMQNMLKQRSGCSSACRKKSPRSAWRQPPARHGDHQTWTARNGPGREDRPEVAGDVEMLQDMVMAASNEAARKVDEQTQKSWAAWVCLPDCSSRQGNNGLADPLRG